MASILMDELTCPHCMERLRRPVTMPCGHHVCASCEQALSQATGKFNCPVCLTTVFSEKCIPNNLMDKMIQELSNLKATSSPTNSSFPVLSVPPCILRPQFCPTNFPPDIYQQSLRPSIQVGLHPSNAELPVFPAPQPLPPPTQQKAQNTPTDRLVLTHNQRQYIRYVVVTDSDNGTKYTVGIKHVLNTVGSNQLVQLLERNIGSEYKKGSSKRVCKHFVEGSCIQGAECPYIHVTQEGWEARRKFSSANQKRNKETPVDGSPLPVSLHSPVVDAQRMAAGIVGAAGSMPMLRMTHFPPRTSSQGLGWISAMQSAPEFSGPGGPQQPIYPMQPTFGLPSFDIFGDLDQNQHLLPGCTQEPATQLTAIHPAVTEAHEANTFTPSHQAVLQKRSAHPEGTLLHGAFHPFPMPILSGSNSGGFERNGARHDIRTTNASSGTTSTSSTSTSGTSRNSTAIPVNSTSLSEAKDSSAASTSSSIGAISSVSSSGSPLTSPVLLSIGIPEDSQDKPPGFHEEPRALPYFNNANNIWKSFGH